MNNEKDLSLYNVLEQKVVYGEAAKLEDAQLLALIIRSGKDQSISQAEMLLKSCENVQNLVNMSINDIIRIGGINKKQAISVCALFELIKRLSDVGAQERTVIKSNLDVISIFRPIFSRLEVEELWVLYLTATNNVIKKVKISSGGAISSFADTKLILKIGLETLSHSIIVLHNHPSGSAEPSDEDIEFTRKLKKASEYIDINLLDHIVISNDDSYSFLEHNLI